MENPIDLAWDILDGERARLGASSCTFYVRDPWWTDQFRLIVMPGVVIREPMHGFVFPHQERVRIEQGDDFESYLKANENRKLVDKLSPEVEEAQNQSAAPEVYFEFVRRERVQASARVLHRSGKLVDAVLFVNFTVPKNTSRMRREITGIMKKLAGQIRPIGEWLTSQEPPQLVTQLIRLYAPSDSLAEVGPAEAGEVELTPYFKRVCRAVLDAFEVTPAEGFASIHTFQPGTTKVNLFCSEGIPKEPSVTSLPRDSVTSWVALRRKAVLIENVKNSNFTPIYHEVKKDMVTETAVPMIAGQEVIGVLNLESARSGVFQSRDVRSLWYAANQAATAVRLYRQRLQAMRVNDLFKIYTSAITAGGDFTTHIDNLARVFGSWLDAEHCEIRAYDNRQKSFTHSGANYDTFDRKEKPRDLGWSLFLTKRRQPVRITAVKDDRTCDAHIWQQGQWKKLSEKAKGRPKTVNPRVIKAGFRCQLGIPITVLKDCVGVSWLKYNERQEDWFTKERMDQALGLSAHVGTVMHFLQRWAAHDEYRVEEFKKKMFPSEPISTPSLHCSVSTFSFGAPVGGDFYAGVFLDDQKQTFGFLLGDTEGSGASAALQMLPFFSTFRALYKNSRSTMYILERMNDVACELGLRCSAMYFVIELARHPRLRMTAAGEFRLVIKHKNSWLQFPDEASEFANYVLGDERIFCGAETWHPLEAGDLIIGYTDGINEAGPNQDFGHEGVHHAVSDPQAPTDPKGLADHVLKAATCHAGGSLNDDATVMVIKLY